MDDAERKSLAEFIYESDAIEGIQDDIKLLEEQIAEGKKDGHVGTMLLLGLLAKEGRDRLVDKGLICQVQGLITAEQHLKPGGPELPQKWIGKYRRVDVWVGGRECMGPATVPRAIIDWIGDVCVRQGNARSQNLQTNIRNIADLHFRFERIHPFADGNGRTGRALVWYLFRCAGIKPFIFTNCDKHETYYLCFEEPEAMRRYFMRKMGFGIQTLPVRR